MSLWSRISNVFRGSRLNREIDEELESHIQEAMERQRDPEEVWRAFGAMLRHREASRDARLVVWLDSLRADAIFGWRQLNKHKVSSAAAMLSLALAMGACIAAFRLIDALLLRPLPVANPERLYDLSRRGIGPDGRPAEFDGWAYPAFQRMRAAAKGQAELIAVSYVERTNLTYGSEQEIENAYLQYVSGWMFSEFGLQPAAGRLLTESDDEKPRVCAYAVLSYDYWSHRFRRDPKIVGRNVRIGNDFYTIIGVGPKGFTGTVTGTMTDIFLPAMMNPAVTRDDTTWHRTLAVVRPEAPLEPLQQRLDATSRAFEEERAKSFVGMPKEALERFLSQKLLLEPAASGVSELQRQMRRPLAALAVLVALVLLIACGNVANLMSAQAAARAREMALRVSIGGGRRRLMQLVLVEGVLLALFAAVIGGLFALWSGPFVVGMINPPDDPVRLVLPGDWRVCGFSGALALGLTCLFALAPALRASAVNPAHALKGGENPHSRRRLMHGLATVQVAFCFLVLFVAGLFVATFQRLAHVPTGFSAERILVLDTVAKTPQSAAVWDQVGEHLRLLPGVERVALMDRALLDGFSWNNFISVNGAPPNGILAYFRRITPGWADTMKVPLLDGRDFRLEEAYPNVAIVNKTFAKTYFDGQDPVGKTFALASDEGRRVPFHIVGLAGDTFYESIREPLLPVAFVPFRSLDAEGKPGAQREGAFLVRMASANSLALAQTLRQEVARARPELRVGRVRTQLEINQAQTVRERLLAILAAFFAAVALLLAAVGLYGVLHYSVLQRRREIGIRIAVGAGTSSIARLVSRDVFVAVLAGGVAGLALGMISVRYIEALFYQVKATDAPILFFPSITIFAAAFLAALPGVLHAVRIDPVMMLRAD